MTTDTLAHETASLLAGFGIGPEILSAGDFAATSPIDGSRIAALRPHTPGDLDTMIAAAERAFPLWRAVPPPRRGELVRLFAEELRRHKPALGRLVSIEAGKILEEGQGEVQEMIDICDFAVGLSRQLYGKVIASERPGHRMLESWHPLGPAGIITAFNFPVAVWSWNAALALVCGDPLIWKPSDKTPLCALACNAILGRAIARLGDMPDELRQGLSQVAIGGAELGEALCDDRRVPLVSATGSTRMGAIVGPRVAQRFGRTLLELGGNNGMIVASSADLDLALRAILFAAVGTAGQRCTTLRRLIVSQDIADTLIDQLKRAYRQVRIGNPLEPGTLVGPLIGETAFGKMKRTAVLINCARGPIVDTDALVQALDAKTIAGAALDTVDPEPLPDPHPLRGRDNVVLTPHVAWYSEQAMAGLQAGAPGEVRRVLSGQWPLNVVNRAVKGKSRAGL